MTDADSDVASSRFRKVLADKGIPVMFGPAWRWSLDQLIGDRFSAMHAMVRPNHACGAGRRADPVVGRGDPGGLDVHDLCTVLVRRAVQRYQDAPHPGLGGDTPAEAFRRLREPYGRHTSPSPIAAMFGW